MEIHIDAIQPGEQVLIVDDLIATGGTAEAAIKLIRAHKGVVVGCSFIIDLPELGGRKRLEALDVKVLSRSEEHTSELQSLMRISYAVFCLKKTKNNKKTKTQHK